MKVKKFGLKLNVQKTKIMASGPITSWQTDGETVETVSDYFWGLQNHYGRKRRTKESLDESERRE